MALIHDVSEYFSSEKFGFDKALYARGYIVSRDRIDPPHQEWRHARIGGLHVSYDPRNRFASATCRGHFVATIGLVIDAEAPGRHPSETVGRACAELARSREAFFEALDGWGGRFVVLFGSDDAPFLAGDATAMRTAFHAPGRPGLVASHAALVAEAIGAERNGQLDALKATQEWKDRRARYLPGAITAWKGVRFLTANTALSLADGRLVRFWPRTRLGRAAPKQAAAIARDNMTRQLEWVQAQGRPVVCSLTAGLDSRVTAAIARPFEGISYFTYHHAHSERDAQDVILAQEIAARLGLPHSVLPPKRRASRRLGEILLRNNAIPHLTGVAEAYARRFPQNAIHIRSNLSEIGRAFYKKEYGDRTSTMGQWLRERLGLRSRPGDTQTFGPRQMARVWRRLPHNKIAVRAFADWRTSVGFQKAGGGIDKPDLFYWEHRMSCWHGRVLLESDIAFDTMSPFNHRQVLSALLMTDLADRRASAAHRLIVEAGAPEIADVMVNAIAPEAVALQAAA